MRVRLDILAVMVICLLALSACANPFFGILGVSSSPTSAPTSTPRLSGSSWVLTQLHTDGQIRTLAPTAPVTLQFQQDDGVYVGSSGCNYYTGVYVVSADRLAFKLKSITQVACFGPIMSQEVAFLNTMHLVRGYELSDHTLTLKGSGGEALLVFTPA